MAVLAAEGFLQRCVQVVWLGSVLRRAALCARTGLWLVAGDRLLLQRSSCVGQAEGMDGNLLKGSLRGVWRVCRGGLALESKKVGVPEYCFSFGSVGLFLTHLATRCKSRLRRQTSLGRAMPFPVRLDSARCQGIRPYCGLQVPKRRVAYKR